MSTPPPNVGAFLGPPGDGSTLDADERARKRVDVPGTHPGRVSVPAPSAAPPQPGDVKHLRLVSAEACDLRSVLRAIRSGDAPMSAYATYIDRTRDQMEGLIGSLQGDDAIRHIQNTWEQMQANRLLREPNGQFGAQEQLQLLGLLDAQCRQIVYWTGVRTVPERLKDWLALSEPGYAIPFHAVFEDEVPDAEDRQKILDQLAWSPGFLTSAGGIVDPASGLVYRYDTRSGGVKRVFPLVFVVLMVAAGMGVVWLLEHFPPLHGRGLANLQIGWGAVLAGLVVHAVVATAKGLRAQGGLPPGLPINRFLVLLNARLGFVLFRVVVALIGYLGLAYAVSESTTFTAFAFNAFLIGYSLDSVVELFGTTLDQRSAAQLANLRKQLGTQG